MAKKPIPTPEELRQLLRYEPETGKLYWLERPVSMFVDGDHSAGHTCAAWNAKFAGKIAFTATTKWGHKRGRLAGNNFKAHRVAWALYTGNWPNGEIDHINGDPGDNRIENLRVVSSQQNKWNRGSRPNSISKFVGVARSSSGTWYGQIVIDGKFVYLGSFATEEDAARARDVVATRYHGKFARLNFPSQSGLAP
jgi:hypothetical protein